MHGGPLAYIRGMHWCTQIIIGIGRQYYACRTLGIAQAQIHCLTSKVSPVQWSIPANSITRAVHARTMLFTTHLLLDNSWCQQNHHKDSVMPPDKSEKVNFCRQIEWCRESRHLVMVGSHHQRSTWVLLSWLPRGFCNVLDDIMTCVCRAPT